MHQREAGALATLALVCCSLGSAQAQKAQNEWWPELDLYWTDPSGHYRLYGLASISHTADTQARQGTIGLHADYLSTSGFFLWPSGIYVRVGYQQLESLPAGSYHEQRALFELTSGTRIGVMRVLNRARVEQRWIAGVPSQRFRDRIRVDHGFELTNGWAFTPYAAFEPYYDTEYHALSRTGYRFGSEVARYAPVRIDGSYVHQDNRFGDVRHINALALSLSLYFGRSEPVKR